ncbi:RNA-binding protein MEX3B [Ixodes scapularis]|nr:RNA-binding protein MEX3B [Ixodes scapularis]
MPASASLFPDMERGSGLEDQRALQLALELSMLGLNNEHDSLHPNFEADTRNKKSQNTTECVPVPSSEHVAEIVGRQGCKIKALRAKTNTYIKTPVRGEEPVFVVTGRKEDVGAAKREILSAAEHFSQIRAQRKNNLNGSLAPGPNSNIPGQTTIQVRVPYRVVGLVVGPKGATIKRIQQQTNTYIVTPSRDKEPVFEVTGLPESVDAARREIEAHIAMRTGGSLDDEPPPPEGSFPEGPPSRQDLFSFPAKLYAANGGFGSAYESDEGLGDSPTFDPAAVAWPDFARGTNGDAFAAPPPVRGGPLRRDAGPDSVASSPTDSLGSTGGGPPAPGKRGKRDCVVCFESEVVAALVPCGHNMFCMECANRVCGKGEPQCPVCHQPCAHAIRIYS